MSTVAEFRARAMLHAPRTTEEITQAAKKCWRPMVTVITASRTSWQANLNTVRQLIGERK